MPELVFSLSEAVRHARAAYKRGDLGEAERFCRGILDAAPDHFDTIHLIAIIQSQRGLHLQALANYDKALSIRPDHAKALHNRGLSLHQLRNFEQALASYNKALAIPPAYAEAMYSRGTTLKELKRYDEALESYDGALVIQPNNADAHINRGNVLKALKRFDEALASYDRALASRPNYVEALSNRGLVLHETKSFEQALKCYDQALAVQPDHAEVLYNCGNTLRELNRFEEALAYYDKALASRPDFAGALFNRGLTLHDLGRFEEALLDYSQASAAKPDLVDVHFNEAICRLLIGDFDRGWEKYEWRWQSNQTGATKRNFVQPMWLGHDDIADKTILLHTEQGFGDTIQFCRYVRLVAEKTPNVFLEVQPPLKRLLSGVKGARIVLARGEPLPHFDMHCPLLSLPRVFATRLETIPADEPYLSASTTHSKKWGLKLLKSRSIRVGINWAGNPNFRGDPNRSIGLSPMLPLLSCHGVKFFSIQKDLRVGDLEVLRDNPHITHLGEQIETFEDTAAIISSLDLVISSDTSVAHLAGALGKPVWILLQYVPDWRWLLEREDSPWYRTARLFRQDETRAWGGVIARVRDALRNFVESEHPRSFPVEAERTPLT